MCVFKKKKGVLKKTIFFSSASSHVPSKKKGVKNKFQENPSNVSPKKKKIKLKIK
jgi:hypothetical protein